jgi:hypothetical protein
MATLQNHVLISRAFPYKFMPSKIEWSKIPLCSESRMIKVLDIINQRQKHNMREFAASCRKFYKPNCV